MLNPVVAVDNNVPSFTDPVTGATQTDTMVDKAVYVAWNTNNTAPITVPATVNFNPNIIKVAASADGGMTFTTPQIVNSGGNFSPPTAPGPSRFSDPQIVFTQGSADGSVPGGQLVFVWDDFGKNQIDLASSQPDGGNLATAVAGTATFAATAVGGGLGAITDASAGVASAAIVGAGNASYMVGDILKVAGGTTNPALPASIATLKVTATSNGAGPGTVTGIAVQNPGSYLLLPINNVTTTDTTTPAANGATFSLAYGPTAGDPRDTAATTIFTSNVTITDPNFVVSDLQVTLSILDPHLNELSVELVQPVTGTIINLMQAQTNDLGQTVDSAGNPIPPSANQATGVANQANLGEVFSGVTTEGTVFDSNAARSISDPGAATPYIAHFKPDKGNLDGATIVGQLGTSANISGTWELIVTDDINDGETTVCRRAQTKASMPGRFISRPTSSPRPGSARITTCMP